MSKDTLQPLSLITSLMQPEAYDPPVEKCELIETHISWVILAGAYAYKNLSIWAFSIFPPLKKDVFIAGRNCV
jgi:hypothetical protein